MTKRLEEGMLWKEKEITQKVNMSGTPAWEREVGMGLERAVGPATVLMLLPQHCTGQNN